MADRIWIYGLWCNQVSDATFVVISFILNLFLVSSDAERYDKKSFCVADVDGARIVFYVMSSREPYFLFVVPPHLKQKCPWEILLKPIHHNPDSYQLHCEFVSDVVLPNWYQEKRTCRVQKTIVLPLQGTSIFKKHSFH